jgi:hypothetical protein
VGFNSDSSFAFRHGYPTTASRRPLVEIDGLYTHLYFRYRLEKRAKKSLIAGSACAREHRAYPLHQQRKPRHAGLSCVQPLIPLLTKGYGRSFGIARAPCTPPLTNSINSFPSSQILFQQVANVQLCSNSDALSRYFSAPQLFISACPDIVSKTSAW